jgi:hypothetical protein
MAERAAGQPPAEFLIVSLPDSVEPGATLRLLRIEKGLAAAQRAIAALDTGALGRVAILERKVLYRRQPAVENVELAEPISKKPTS